MLALEEQPEWLRGGQLRDYQLRGLNFLINRCAQAPPPREPLGALISGPRAHPVSREGLFMRGLC